MDFVCNLEAWAGLRKKIREEDGVDVRAALDKIKEYRKNAMLFAARHASANVLYSIINYDPVLDIVHTVSLFKDTCISDTELVRLIDRYPDARFGVLYANSARKACVEALVEEKSKHIVPLTLKEANAFVAAHHRHHADVVGCKFAVGLQKTVKGEEQLIGVAICGRPVSRILDDGMTLEINRLCTIEEENSCSMLYGACCRVATAMGYKKVITYTLESEPGTSLRASNFVLEDPCCGGENWTGARKRKKVIAPEMKKRWGRVLIAN